MKHESLSVIGEAVRSPHATKKHIDFAMGHWDKYINGSALKSRHATKEQITDVMNRWSGSYIADEAQRELDIRNNNESQQP